MYACNTSLESSQIPKWLLQDWTQRTSNDGNQVDSQPVSHLLPCAICNSLVPWNFSFIHPFIASHCIRLCRNCLESIENRRMELADRGLIFSSMSANEQLCACCCSESQTLFTCVGCTRSYCKVCVTRILGEYAVATGLVQLQAWFCPLCVRFNVQAKETLKNSRKDQFVLLSLVSFAQARNWETPKALAPLTCRSLNRNSAQVAFIAGPDEKVFQCYEANFHKYCSWLNEKEELQQNRYRDGKLLFIPKSENLESNGLLDKKKNDSLIHHAFCFWCKEPEANITCSFPKCSKTYHRDCIMSEIVEGADWICPWHACLTCGAVESNENILKKCRTCPISYCNAHVPADRCYQGEEVYYYDEHYILCQRCTPFVERPNRKAKSYENSNSSIGKKDMDVVVRNDNHKHISNQEISKEWKRSRLEQTREEASSEVVGTGRREHRNRMSKAVGNSFSQSHSSSEHEVMISNRRAGRKSDDVNSRIVRLVAQRSQTVPMDVDKMKEYIQEDIEDLGVSGPCRLAALYVLKKAGRPLTTSEIAERMVLEGLWFPTGATPVNTIAGLLSSDSKKAKEKNGSYIYFDRLGPSLFVYNRRGKG